MRTLLIITFLANILFAFGSLPWTPDRAIIESFPDGTTTIVITPPAVDVVLLCLISIMLAVVLVLSALLPIMPARTFWMPNRDYWTNEENRPEMIRRYRWSFDLMGVEFMIFFLYGQNVALLKANEIISSDTAIPLWLGGLGVLFVLFIIEGIRLHLSFRLPKNGEGS